MPEQEGFSEPTTEEIMRVAAYWERVRLLTCKHDAEISITSGEDTMRCTQCGQPLRMRSDIQLEELMKRSKE